MTSTYNLNSLKGLNPKARFRGKQNVNLTLLPKTIACLKKTGNASKTVDALVALASYKNWNSGAIEYLELIAAIEEQLGEIIAKSERKETGYRTNGFGEGLREIKKLLVRLNKEKKQ